MPVDTDLGLTVNDERASYFSYLSRRSRLGWIYRVYLLYPRLTSRLEGTVLDFGCGIGDFLAFRDNTIGVDINEFNVDYCVSKGLPAHLIENNKIPFSDGYFSGVVLDNVIEHLSKDEVGPTLNEILRVLRPGGQIVAGVPGIKGYRADTDHKTFYTQDALIQLFTNQSCRTLDMMHMPIKCSGLSKILNSYCVYGIFEAPLQS